MLASGGCGAQSIKDIAKSVELLSEYEEKIRRRVMDQTWWKNFVIWSPNS
jgi:hypothetical protein